MTHAALCPHCHQQMPPAHGVTLDFLNASRGASAVQLTPREARAFEALLHRFPRTISNDQLITAMYPCEADEPEETYLIIKTTISHIRKKILVLGLGVRATYGVGYSLYELVAEKVEA